MASSKGVNTGEGEEREDVEEEKDEDEQTEPTVLLVESAGEDMTMLLLLRLCLSAIGRSRG
jgi:hypothetical protein